MTEPLKLYTDWSGVELVQFVFGLVKQDAAVSDIPVDRRSIQNCIVNGDIKMRINDSNESGWQKVPARVRVHRNSCEYFRYLGDVYIRWDKNGEIIVFDNRPIDNEVSLWERVWC